MLKSDNPKRRVSQAPIKLTTCTAGCGTPAVYRTNPRVLCGVCRLERRADSARKAAAKQRRKKGVQQVKGAKINCQRCGVVVTLNRCAGAKYCRPCYLAANGEDARRRSREKAATPEGRAAANRWQRRKRATDPAWRVTAHMRVLMHRALNGRKAGRSWREFVPYSLDELMYHLERQFLPGMTWANKGRWHIDHVIPLASFDFTSPEDADFQAAWALSNLRPLWGLDNIRKNARRTHLL